MNLDEVVKSRMQSQLTLGELIDLLESYEIYGRGNVIVNGFGSGHSDRGFHEDVAFSPVSNTTVSAMLTHAREMLNTKMDGHKGGAYNVTEKTDVWVAEYGETGRVLNWETLSAMCYNNPLPEAITD